MAKLLNKEELAEPKDTPIGLWMQPKVKIILGIGVLLVVAWFYLGCYLHQQVVQSRAKVEQARLEAQRREERLKRGAQYKYDLQERTRTPQTRNAFDGR